MDSAGNQVNTYAYEPFGQFSSTPVEGVVQPHKFHGGYLDSAEGFYKMGARYYEPGTGRFTQPEPAWSNPMFNTMGGRNLLVARSYGTGATVGQEMVPLPGGYYWPGSEYNWYSYAGSDPVDSSDVAGYQDWRRRLAGALIIFAIEVPTIAMGVVAVIQPELAVPMLKGIEYYHYFTLPIELGVIYEFWIKRD